MWSILTGVVQWLLVPGLGALSVWLLMKLLKTRKALLAVALAVEEKGNKTLKAKIKQIAESININTWLKDFVNNKVGDGKAKEILNTLLGSK